MLLKDKIQGRRLILASRSPRRRELLAGCGLDHVIAADYECEEIYPEELTPSEVPVYLAKLKSQAYPGELCNEDILITADTVVVLGDSVIGKPSDRDDAIEMLRSMSGEKHTVVTGVTLRSRTHSESFAVKTDVWFRRLREEEIEFYVDNYRPFDKAGSYGIQEWLGYVAIGRIEGSFYNVMGLPIQSLYVNLERLLDNNEI